MKPGTRGKVPRFGELQLGVGYGSKSKYCSVAPPEFCRPSPTSPRGDPDIHVRFLTGYARYSTGITCDGPSTAYPNLFNQRCSPAPSLPVVSGQEIRLPV